MANKLFSASNILTKFAPKRMMSSDVNIAEIRAKADLWKNVFFFVFVPITILTHIHVYYAKKKTHGLRPEYKPYEYLRRVNKEFPWRDGKTPLFFNPYFNPVPGEGYITDELKH